MSPHGGGTHPLRCRPGFTANGGNAASTSSRLLDVPFVPQTEALCGGAAVAMVLRYWGATTVYAEDFATLVDESAEGINVTRLSHAIADRGWRAMPFTGSAADIEDHLARGRPIVALIEDRPGRYHYVVVVAVTREHVVVHDPAHGPFRIVERTKFDRAWAVTDRTTLLVLPAADRAETSRSMPPNPDAAADNCSTPLVEATRLAQSGDVANAEALLVLIAAECPGPAQRELAGIRFLQQRWADVERLAADTAARDPTDLHAWQLLASARFLQGDATGALDAWNRREEPRVDLARIEGLDRMRHAVIADLLGVAPGDLLTGDRLARANRRVAALPAIQMSRVGYTPRADGRAMIDVAVLEKPAVPRKWPSMAAMAVHAGVARELRFDAANAVGHGELLTTSWRWWEGRPRVSVGLAAPRLWGATGTWRIESSWEQQLYRLPPAAGVDFMVNDRRGAKVSFSDWATGDLRWEVSGGVDRWVDRGDHASAGATVERRWRGDRVAVRVDGTFWRAIGRRSTTFGRSAVAAAWRSAAERAPTWTASAGTYGASAGAPLDLWPAADTGQVGPLLLRAHPLLHDGAVRAEDVSRLLAHATVELQRPLAIRLPARAWWAAFVDAAKRGASVERSRGAVLVDIGVGLRLELPGTPHLLRLDVAHGLRDGRLAFSAGWQTGWNRR